jgi:RNA polymerase subunit RPABC4/transcription elongation factor Spt4
MKIRFDDICENSDVGKLLAMVEFALELGHECLLGISPMISGSEGEQPFPEIFKCYSDYRKFYEVDACTDDVFWSDELGSVYYNPKVTIASHGLIHIDHQRLTYGAKEMSILLSCKLLNARVFIPPFNRWDKEMDLICQDNEIELIKWEDGWRSMEHEEPGECTKTVYLHSRNMTITSFKNWLAKWEEWTNQCVLIDPNDSLIYEPMNIARLGEYAKKGGW